MEENKKQIENPNLNFINDNNSTLDYPNDESDESEGGFIKKGTNPLLWNSPTYIAAGELKEKGFTENPNEYLKRTIENKS